MRSSLSINPLFEKNKMKPNDLLKEINGILVVNLLDYIYPMADKFGHLFKDPEPGIYMLNNVDPVISAGMKVYTRKSREEDTALDNIDNIVDDIIDIDGRIIIPAPIMLKKRKYLSPTPSIPSRPLKVAKLIVEEYVDSMLAHGNPTDYETLAEEHLTEEGMVLFREGYFEATCSRLISEVARFIGSDTWNFYLFDLNNTDLMITKSCDYRVYDWTLIQEERAEMRRQEEEAKLNI